MNKIFATLMLVTAAHAASTPKVLHSFGLGLQLGGSSLYASLIRDAAGNLYGTAEAGGGFGKGVVFRLSSGANGVWTETVLHSFKGGNSDGATPHAAVTMDSFGNLYGTTTAGGNSICLTDCGIVFELVPTTTGPRTEIVLHDDKRGRTRVGCRV